MFLSCSGMLGLELKTFPDESEGDRGNGILHGYSGTCKGVTCSGGVKGQFHIMSPYSQFHVLAGVR